MTHLSHLRRATSGPFIIALAVAALLFATGCAKQGRWTQADYTLSYGPPLQSREVLSNPLLEADLKPLSTKVFLVSDNQRHELLGNGVELFRTSGADEHISGSAIRPPQLDLFGQDLLVEAVDRSDGFIVHLGDACDISNTGEFVHFAWDMRHARHGWVMAPGNHDGFIFGNSSRTIRQLIEEWNGSGEKYETEGTAISSEAMQKDRYVSFYLSALILQDSSWSGLLARSIGPECESLYQSWVATKASSEKAHSAVLFSKFYTTMIELEKAIFKASDLTGEQKYHEFILPKELEQPGRPHLRRVAWEIDKDRVWRSFLIQEVDVSAPASGTDSNKPPISLLLLDSSQYGVQPSLDFGFISGFYHLITFGTHEIQVAGLHGNILPSQESAAHAFGQRMKEEGRKWILASHHTYADLGVASVPRYDGLRQAGGVPLTLSAHTHEGEIRWNHDGDGDGDVLEVNLGSILDAPPEYRDLQVFQVGNRLAVSSHRYLMEDAMRQEGLLADDHAAYRPSPGDPDFYLNYQQGTWTNAADTDFTVKRILLAAYLRLFRHLKADAPDQSATHWPTGPDGKLLTSHEEVTAATEGLLTKVQKEDIGTLTRFLYELREFDRTRKFSAEGTAKMRAYRISQAIWASRAELSTRHRHPPQADPDLSFFILPPSDAK